MERRKGHRSSQQEGGELGLARHARFYILTQNITQHGTITTLHDNIS